MDHISLLRCFPALPVSMRVVGALKDRVYSYAECEQAALYYVTAADVAAWATKRENAITRRHTS